jgi:hypothetical protein
LHIEETDLDALLERGTVRVKPGLISLSQADPNEVHAEASVPGGLVSLAELDNSEVVSGQLLTTVYYPKITLDAHWFKCSASCVRLFPETNYVRMMVDVNNKRLIFKASKKFGIDAAQWSRKRGDKLVNRQVSSRKIGFCEKLYKMMNWIPENRYKVLAVYQELEGQQIIVFNLRDCEMTVPETVRQGETTKKVRRSVLPENLRESFGRVYTDHVQMELDIRYIDELGSLSEITFGEAVTEGKMPTNQEVIIEQYTPGGVT